MGAVSSIGNAVESVVDTIDDVIVEPIENVVEDIDWTDIRDTAETAAVIAGNYFLPGSSLVTSKLVSEGAQENLSSDLGQMANLAAGVSGGMQGNTSNYGFGSSDPNAVGGVTGPDNIDVGGGWSPSGGATAAGTELTAQEVLDKIKADQASSMTAAETQAMIDAEAAEAATAPVVAQTPKAAGMGVTDYLRAGLLVNAVTGDPLGLSGDVGQQGGTGATGFSVVPTPAEWTPPTYAAPSAPIDLSTIFSNQNMLGGTQWQGLPTQQNISFNDIFAAGQQQTPMGMPVDINQIVSSILGQAATSQKSA